MYALDPLYQDGVGLADVLITLGKVLVTFLILLVSVIFMVWFERKVISDMQNRIGPNRAGPFGLLQTLADGMKLIFKEDLIPNRAQRFVFLLAPYLSVIPAFLIFAIVPVGGTLHADDPGVITIAGHETYAQLADPPVGVLWVLAVSSIAVYGVMLAGWASGSKYPLLGSVRATAQMVSYEAAMGLAVVTLVLTSGGLSTRNMAVIQAGEGFGGIVPNWNVIITGFVPFVIFFIAALAEMNRPPFDLVEAEQELVGGYHTEYSSIRFGMFFVAEFMHPITMSAVIVTLWFGGPSGPQWFGPVSGIIWLVAKIFVFLYVFVLIRGTLPRFRYDQLMDLGWKVLIPLSLAWLLLLAAINIGRDAGWNLALTILISFVVVGGTCFAILTRAIEISRQRRELGEGADLMGYLDGFRITIGKTFNKGSQSGKNVTSPYVKDEGGKRAKPVRLHGRHVLNRYEDGMEKCIGCELCAGVCPARCIYVRGEDNDPADPVSPGERYGFIYEINYLRCIHCDLCVEACPTEAITETKLFEFSFTNRQDAIYTKAELVVDDDGRAQKLPWEDWSDAEEVERHTSAWMRATAPNGDADFEGIVAWAGELGYGERPAEQGQRPRDEQGQREDEGGHH